MSQVFTLPSFVVWYLVGLVGITAYLVRQVPQRPADKRGHPALLTIGTLAAAVGGPLIVLVFAWAEHTTRRTVASDEELTAFLKESVAQAFSEEGIPRSFLEPVKDPTFALSIHSPYGSAAMVEQIRADTMLAMHLVMFVAAVEPHGYDTACTTPGFFDDSRTRYAFDGWLAAALHCSCRRIANERSEFECWAAQHTLPLTTDASHYTYTNPETAAARVGWTAWLARFDKERTPADACT
jgi:hypothetical protein